MNFIVRKARIEDLPAIMRVEKNGFIPQIQEEESVFKSRIQLCPDLFLIFQEEKTGCVAGYLSAEFLKKIPETPDEVKLGHIPCKNSDSADSEHFCSVPAGSGTAASDNIVSAGPIHQSGRKIIYISSFSILPEFRGCGNGKYLWNKSLEVLDANKPEVFVLLVNEVWKGAYKIYSKSGFEEIVRFENFFPAEDGSFTGGILMKKNCR